MLWLEHWIVVLMADYLSLKLLLTLYVPKFVYM